MTNHVSAKVVTFTQQPLPTASSGVFTQPVVMQELLRSYPIFSVESPVSGSSGQMSSSSFLEARTLPNTQFHQRQSAIPAPPGCLHTYHRARDTRRTCRPHITLHRNDRHFNGILSATYLCRSPPLWGPCLSTQGPWDHFLLHAPPHAAIMLGLSPSSRIFWV